MLQKIMQHRLVFGVARRAFATKIEPQSLDLKETGIKYGLGAVISPLYLTGLGWFDVPKSHVNVLTNWGKYTETVADGLHFRVPVGLARHKVFIGQQSHKMPESKIVDGNGNPIIVSGIVNFEIKNPEKYVFNINREANYIHNQAEAVLKRVVSKYPYESREEEQVSLKNETQEINEEMKTELEKLVEKAGIQVNEFYLSDMNYAPEIASQMLIRQQAKAYIDAKNEIASAGVQIVNDTLQQLKEQKLNLSSEAESQLVSNLLTVIASGNNVQPTLPLHQQS